MKLKQIPALSLALRWTLAISLTASPLLAEYPPQSSSGISAAPHRPVVQVLDENNNPLVGSAILSTLSADSQTRVLPNESQEVNAASAGQINTGRTATELGTAPEPTGNPDRDRAEPGGKTLSTLIIAALIAGGVVALILLLGGGGHKTPAAPHSVTGPPAEVGTILTPGTPSVGTPH